MEVVAEVTSQGGLLTRGHLFHGCTGCDDALAVRRCSRVKILDGNTRQKRVRHGILGPDESEIEENFSCNP